jgi:hypothetical protein
LNTDKLSREVINGGTLNIRAERRFSQVVIVKLLEAMGYVLTNENEVGIEVPMQVGHETKYADYKLSNGDSCFILDAKSPSVEIEGDIHAYEQVHSYYRILHCKYGALYNGKKLILFKEDSSRPVFIWRYEQDHEDLSVFEALSKENFPGALEEFLSSLERLTKLRQFMEDKRHDLQNSLIDKISIDSGINDKEFITEHVEVSVDYTSNLTEDDNDVDQNVSGSVLLKSFRYYGPDTGLEFVQKYKAWGFIRVKGKPDYLALYDADNHVVSKVFKVREVEELNDNVIKEFSGRHSKSTFLELRNQGKKILRLGSEVSVHQIPAGRRNIFRGKYTTLEKIKSANTTDDL